MAAGRQAASYLHNVQAQMSRNKPIVNSQTKVTDPKVTDPELTIVRKSGGKTWEDSTLLEWDPKHFRLFVGNLGPDANDELLILAFSRYKSMSKAKVPMDKKTGKNKGYGFVAFSDLADYLAAFKEMNGKYVGLHPIHLKRAETKIEGRVGKKKGRR